MSDAFSFMFGFYGLLLGLAVAEVVSGFSRAYDERHRRPIGIVGPLFGLLLLVDLITFWMNAFSYRDMPKISYLTALAVSTVALLYYFAATQIFPKESEKQRVDDHIMEHRWVVVLCALASNVMTQVPNVISAYSTPWPLSDIVIWASANMFYYVLLVLAGWVKSKMAAGIVVAAAILFVTSVTAIFS